MAKVRQQILVGQPTVPGAYLSPGGVLQHRTGQGTDWAAAAPVLAKGEFGIVTDSNGIVTGIKIGDGATGWSALPFWTPGNGTFAPLPGAVQNPLTGLFHVTGFGAKGDGSTDDTTAVQSAINAAQATGGTVFFPPGRYKLLSALTVPNDASSPVAKQSSVILRGAATSWLGDAAHSTNDFAAAVLDFRAAPTVAHIDTRGCGLLSIEDMTLTTPLTGGKPFISTTNTTLSLRRVRFLGPASQSGSSCNTDAVWLGGSTTNFDMTGTSAFQGYGSRIEHCEFDHIQRGIYGRAYCNSVIVRDNFWTANCGGTAAVELDSLAGAVSTGNTFQGNLIEVTNYTYAVVLNNSPGNMFMGNSYWDYSSTNYMTACISLQGTAGASINNTFFDFFQGIPTAKYVQDAAGGNQWSIYTNGVWSGPQVFGTGGNEFFIQPLKATGSETARLWQILRSGAEPTNPNAQIAWVEQQGTFHASGAAAGFYAANGATEIHYSWDGIIQPNGGDLPLYAGTGTNDTIHVARGTLKLSAKTTATRPNAGGVGPGGVMYDTTLSKPIYSDGTNWRDAAGTIV